MKRRDFLKKAGIGIVSLGFVGKLFGGQKAKKNKQLNIDDRVQLTEKGRRLIYDGFTPMYKKKVESYGNKGTVRGFMTLKTGVSYYSINWDVSEEIPGSIGHKVNEEDIRKI